MKLSIKAGLLLKAMNIWQSLFNGRTNVEEKAVSNSHYPFELKEHPEHGHYVMLGNCIVSEPFETKEQAINAINPNDWEFMISVISAVEHMNRESKKLADSTKKITKQN